MAPGKLIEVRIISAHNSKRPTKIQAHVYAIYVICELLATGRAYKLGYAPGSFALKRARRNKRQAEGCKGTRLPPPLNSLPLNKAPVRQRRLAKKARACVAARAW